MTDVVQTENQGGASAPDMSGKVADLEARLAAVLKERDTHAERANLAATLQTKHDKLAADFAALTGERDKLTTQVTTLTNEKREGAILDKLSTALPHASRTEVRRMFLGLAVDGKVERYAEDADKTSAAVLEILKTENSALLRAPVGATGGTNPSTVQSPSRDPLASLFLGRRR
ncbi:hypothetical protein [Nannocystis pusilla]|uniref:hypothetical protein n=1 Tax=Nannocystis pusilla TaxID=889268 RepID=UPI003DA40CD2